MSQPRVELHILDHGVITLELDAEKAPKSVANFLAYVSKGHFDKTIFHRVIPGFMIQGGGFEPGMTQKPTDEPIENEANNGLRNDHYTVAMARTGEPHSATAQFFINVVDNAFLDPTPAQPGYTVFGKVVSGMEVINRIRATPTSSGGRFGSDVPRNPIVIQSAVML